MSCESAKANQRRVHDPLWRRVMVGRGIDIGAGNDLVTNGGHWPDVASCEVFDVAHGDANCITRQRPRAAYDFVYSSHCLEHMRDPAIALREWWALVKPGGYLAVAVPDEDLYEQGHWPSRFNGDHQWTFTISKPAGESWSPQSVNVWPLLAENLERGRILELRIADTGYDYRLRDVDQTFAPYNAEAAIEWVVQKVG